MEPTSLEVSMRSARRAARALAVGGGIGAVGVLVALAPVVSGAGTGALTGGCVVGALLLMLAAVILLGWWIGRGESLVVDSRGVRWRSRRRPWTLPWTDVSEAGVHVGYHPGSGPLLLARRSWRVHVELVLVDEDVARRHPGMAHLQRPTLGGGPDRFGVPLAGRRDLVPAIDEALRTFARQRYREVADDGRLAPGMGYAIRR